MTEPPAIVGRYHVVRLIAHGGMGSLYLARDPAIGRLVAIKLLKEGFDDPAARERFAREARAAGRLHHPNIVTVFDVGEHEDRPFIAMEYVAGETLGQLIRRRAIGRLTEKLSILEVLCAALHHAHTAAIVHRDIKPANVMVGEAGVLKVLDFGIARAGGLDVTRAGDVVGTLNYMSPEQLSGHEVDHRTDIYSIGTLAYELVTNQMSFPGTAPTGVLYKILNSSPPPIASLVAGIDADIPAIIEHAMAKDPDDRYQDLEDMRQDLAEVRTRLIETGLEIEEAPNPDAETRFYSVIGSSGHPRSSRRASMLPSSGRDIAARSTVHTPSMPRTRQIVFLGVAVAALAVALAAIWMVTRPAVDSPSGSVATASQQVQSPQATPTATLPVDGRQPEDGNRAAVEAQLRVLKTAARQQLVAGERQAAVDTLVRALALDAKDPEVNALVDELVRVARAAVNEARTAAGRRGARSSRAYRDAQAREREADTLMRTGDRIPAVQAFWAAASRYSEVPESTGQSALATPPAAALPPAAQPSLTTPVDPPAPAPSRTQIPATPPPLKPNPAPADKTAPAPLPAPLKPEPPPIKRDPSADPLVAQTAAIRETLRRYIQAYQSLDSSAVGEVMPALTPDQLRTLGRDLSNYRSYIVEIRDERIAVEGETATVTCQVVRSFETKNGVAGNNTVETVFHLRRLGSAWMIQRLESR